MSKEQKILDQFCKKVAEKGISIFAQDAVPAEKPEWITMNGTHIHVGEGETPKEAGEKFAAKKEAEKGNVSQRGRTGISKGVSEAIGGRGRVAFPKQSESEKFKDFIKNTFQLSELNTEQLNQIKDKYLDLIKKEDAEQNLTKKNSSIIPKKTSLKDLEVKLSKKSVPLSKKEQAVHNSMMDLIHEQHQYEINRRDYLDAQKTMKQLENTYRGKFTPEYQKAKQKADAALTKYSFALHKFRDLQSKMKTEHGIELTDKL